MTKKCLLRLKEWLKRDGFHFKKGMLNVPTVLELTLAKKRPEKTRPLNVLSTTGWGPIKREGGAGNYKPQG